MDGRFNTIAGWVLGAGIVLLGATLVSDEIFKAERPETMGYPIAGVQEDGPEAAQAEPPIAHFLQTADAGRGQAAFAKCTGCHTVDQGAANGTGPNLWGAMGAAVAHRTDFNYTEALRGHGGTWDWDTASHWLKSPRAFAEGTRMSFAGMSDPQERADVLLFLNQHGGTLTIPPPPAAAPAAGNAAEGNAAAGNASAGNATEANGAATNATAPH